MIIPGEIPADLTVAYLRYEGKFLCTWNLMDEVRQTERPFVFTIDEHFNRDHFNVNWELPDGTTAAPDLRQSTKTMSFPDRARALLVAESIVPLGIISRTLRKASAATGKEQAAYQPELETQIIDFPPMPLPLHLTPLGEAAFKALFSEYAEFDR